MPPAAYRPTTLQVAARIRARTRDAQGILVGDFTDDGKTTPSKTQVEQEIDNAMAEAYPVFGENIPDVVGAADPAALRKSAQAVIAARAAALVEEGYFQQDITRGTSPYTNLQSDWETGLKRVAMAMEDQNTGDTIGATDDKAQAVGEFPDTPYVSGKRW